jgi:hypothetical protein
MSACFLSLSLSFFELLSVKVNETSIGSSQGKVESGRGTGHIWLHLQKYDMNMLQLQEHVLHTCSAQY